MKVPYSVTMVEVLTSGFEGIGIGRASIFKYCALWITFLLLTICIVNILIAVVSDGYEIHKDNEK